MNLRKFLLIFCMMLLVMLFVNGAIIISNYSLFINDDDDVKKAPQLKRLNAESSVSQDTPVNLLLLGLDEEGERADVIILVNFNPENSKLNMLSIARDTKVFARGRFSKINSLYSAGREWMVADMVGEITGLQVQYYMTMRFKGFREIIDTLGGVKFKVPFNMDYDDPIQGLHIHLDKGMQWLDGSKSEQLVRYRKGNRKHEGYVNGDIGRIKTQQEFVKALIDQKLKLKYLNRLDDVFTILGKYMRTNFGLADISHYIPMVRKIKEEDVKAFILPGESAMEDNAWYYIYDKEKTDDIISTNFYK